MCVHVQNIAIKTQFNDVELCVSSCEMTCIYPQLQQIVGREREAEKRKLLFKYIRSYKFSMSLTHFPQISFELLASAHNAIKKHYILYSSE